MNQPNQKPSHSQAVVAHDDGFSIKITIGVEPMRVVSAVAQANGLTTEAYLRDFCLDEALDGDALYLIAGCQLDHCLDALRGRDAIIEGLLYPWGDWDNSMEPAKDAEELAGLLVNWFGVDGEGGRPPSREAEALLGEAASFVFTLDAIAAKAAIERAAKLDGWPTVTC